MKIRHLSTTSLLSAVMGGLIAAGSANAIATENLFSNPGFSNSLWGWNVNVVNPNEDSIRWTSHGADGMGSSARFFSDGQTNPAWHMQLAQRKAVSSGDVFTLSFDVATTGANEREVTLYMQKDGGGWDLYQEQSCTVPAQGVARCQLVGTAPYSENVNFGIKGADSLWDFTVDNARLVLGAPDLVAPVIDAFTVDQLNVPSTVRTAAISAHDDVGVTGYIVMSWDGCSMCWEPPATPAINDPRWSSTPPTSVTATISTGRAAAIVFVKDAAGNIASETTSFYVGDQYEIDDTPENAKPLIVGAAPQVRNSHEDGAIDWAVFNVVQGQTYTISVSYNEQWYYTGATLALYSANDTTNSVASIYEDTAAYPAPTTITFTASYTGQYYVKYFGRQHYRIAPKETYTLQVN